MRRHLFVVAGVVVPLVLAACEQEPPESEEPDEQDIAIPIDDCFGAPRCPMGEVASQPSVSPAQGYDCNMAGNMTISCAYRPKVLGGTNMRGACGPEAIPGGTGMNRVDCAANCSLSTGELLGNPAPSCMGESTYLGGCKQNQPNSQPATQFLGDFGTVVGGNNACKDWTPARRDQFCTQKYGTATALCQRIEAMAMPVVVNEDTGVCCIEAPPP